MSNGLSNDDILAKFLNYEMDAAELPSNEEVQSWMELADQAATLDVPATKTKEKAWAELEAKISAEESTTATIRPLAAETSNKQNFAPWLASAAAAIALLIGVYFFWPSSDGVFHTGPGEIASVELPDGSRVTLNENSSLNYDSENWSTDRKVQFEGEGFFQVKKGETFTVQTPNLNVQVLGTSFGVNTSTDLTSVACVTGKVKVFDPEDESVNEVITAREFVHVDHVQSQIELGKREMNEANVELPAYATKKLSFSNTPINEVLTAVGEQFNVEIVYNEQDVKRYTGTFYTNSLVEALQFICEPMGFQFIFEGEESVLIQTK